MKTKLLALTAWVSVAVIGSAYAGCGACPGDPKAAAVATPTVATTLCVCPKCGEVAGCDQCCKAAAACEKCGLHKGSPGCCKLTEEQKQSNAPVELKCGKKAGCAPAAAGACKQAPAPETAAAEETK